MEQNWNEEHIKEYLNYAYLEIGDTFNIDIKKICVFSVKLKS